MNLDDLSNIEKIDSQNMLTFIDNLPGQLLTAWNLGASFNLPAWTGIRQVLISGMGGSAIGADLLAAYAAPTCSAPVIVHRDYRLPAWVAGAQTLVIASSHSGDTEETLQVFSEAVSRGCTCLAISTGGKLEQAARAVHAPLLKFEHHGQPRSAVGLSFGLLLSIFARLNLIANPEQELTATVAAMKLQQVGLNASIPAALNPAKRYAGQLVGRWAVVFGSGLLAPVARRWKTQINELAKTWAQFETLPEADHNTLEGILQPEGSLTQMMALFLRGACDLPRNRLRSDLTRQLFMMEGINTDTIDAQGDSALANMWTCLHFGDYVAYYLAIAYGIDPTPVTTLHKVKAELKAAG